MNVTVKPIEIVPRSGDVVIRPLAADDGRPRMPEPLTVRLVTVEDARLIAANGLEVELDAFYAGLLGFERQELEKGLIYRADNFRVIFDRVEPPIVRDDMRVLGIEVASLREAEQKLIDAEIDYARQKPLTPGREGLLLRDPGGNWIELVEAARLR